MQKISIIIPCYNAAKYIDRCISSLVKQTFPLENMELIFVDDASTDDTMEKLAEWEQQYPENILVIYCEKNGRQGTARNIGLSYASGDYIGFVDADDFVDADMYQVLYNEMEGKQCDFASVLYQREDEMGNVYPVNQAPVEHPGELVVIENREQRRELLQKGLPGGICTKLFRASFLRENSLVFPEKITYEDNYFGCLLRHSVHSYVLLDRVMYHYMVNPESTTMRSGSEHFDRLKIEMMKVQELQNRGLFEKYHDEIEYDFLKLYFCNSLALFFTKLPVIPYDMIALMKQTVLSLFPDYGKNPHLHKFNTTEKTFLTLLSREAGEKEIENLADWYRQAVISYVQNSRTDVHAGSADCPQKQEECMTDFLISVIIPCYNVEQHIARCLDSVTGQSIGVEKLQIILVDDCSTDSTLDVVRDYEEKYPDNIWLIPLESNVGVGRARNIGLSYATGTYVGFVDSDDWILPCMYEEMVKKAESGQYEMVSSFVHKTSAESDVAKGRFKEETEDLCYVISGDAQRRELLALGMGAFGTINVWSKLYRLDFLNRYNLRFGENCKFEDLNFSETAAFYVERFCVMQAEYYHYYIHPGSIMTEMTVEKWKENRVTMIHWLEECIDRGLMEQYPEEIALIFARDYYVSNLHYAFVSEEGDVLSAVRETMNNTAELFPDIKENKYVTQPGEDYLRNHQKLLISGLRRNIVAVQAEDLRYRYQKMLLEAVKKNS